MHSARLGPPVLRISTLTLMRCEGRPDRVGFIHKVRWVGERLRSRSVLTHEACTWASASDILRYDRCKIAIESRSKSACCNAQKTRTAHRRAPPRRDGAAAELEWTRRRSRSAASAVFTGDARHNKDARARSKSRFLRVAAITGARAMRMAIRKR
ncbi:hypothetical protein EVAR_37317_1 [Eumeta japonica]|uniref:Uncharacterized protein n=1 Tax=Eumeta variegata TaxID=151549 RepID=A0A4C1WZV1_EUMVA|nr:hypothetical protein EVAR_37317_1 [Eumeta japonica]